MSYVTILTSFEHVMEHMLEALRRDVNPSTDYETVQAPKGAGISYAIQYNLGEVCDPYKAYRAIAIAIGAVGFEHIVEIKLDCINKELQKEW